MPKKVLKKKAPPPRAKKVDTPVEKKIKRLAKKNEALADAVASAPDAPRIEARLIVGELSVLVDASSLERTLGAAEYGHGKGLVDAWPDAAWTGLLVHLGLPAYPLDRAVAEKPVKRLVQRLWYEAVQGGFPKHSVATFTARDEEGQEHYREEFPKAVEAAKEKSERAKEVFAKVRGVSSKSALAGTTTIKLLTKEAHPYRVGTKAANSFELLKKAKTFDEYVKLTAASKAEVYEAAYFAKWASQPHGKAPAYIKLG